MTDQKNIEYSSMEKVNVATLHCKRFSKECLFEYGEPPRCHKCKYEMCTIHINTNDKDQITCKVCKFVHYGVGASNWYYEPLPVYHHTLSQILQRKDDSWPSSEDED